MHLGQVPTSTRHPLSPRTADVDGYAAHVACIDEQNGTTSLGHESIHASHGDVSEFTHIMPRDTHQDQTFVDTIDRERAGGSLELSAQLERHGNLACLGSSETSQYIFACRNRPSVIACTAPIVPYWRIAVSAWVM